MTPLIQDESELMAAFQRWWRQDQQGGWSCRWRRRKSWWTQIEQKLGRHREADAYLFWGESMRIITGETVSSQLLAFGYAEEALTALMLSFLKLGQSVVDIGTHFGYEALLSCRLVGSQGSVIGFEPNPQAWALAAKNLARFPQARVFQEAVGEKSGTLSLQNRPIWESASNRIELESSKGGTIAVTATTLDQKLAGRPRPVDFLKCDAEGFEMPILLGARNLLRQDQPLLVLESDMPSEDGRPSPRTQVLADHLSREGYEARHFHFDGQRLRMGPVDSLRVHHANVAFVPRKFFNWLESVSK